VTTPLLIPPRANTPLYFRYCGVLICIGVICILFASLSCAQDTSSESAYIGIEDVLRLLIMGDSAVRLLVTLRAYSA
jgi:branched-subunit amino acid transport protein AzlD